VEAAKQDSEAAYLITLPGGEARLRCGEVMALEWTDVVGGSRPCLAGVEP